MVVALLKICTRGWKANGESGGVLVDFGGPSNFDRKRGTGCFQLAYGAEQEFPGSEKDSQHSHGIYSDLFHSVIRNQWLGLYGHDHCGSGRRVVVDCCIQTGKEGET